MARVKTWFFAKDEYGTALANCDVRCYEHGTSTLATIYSTPTTASGDLIDQSTFTADGDGFFEFYIPDSDEDPGYDANTTFDINWYKSGTDSNGWVYEYHPFYYLFAVDETDTNTDKNKLLSNEMAYDYEQHIASTYEDYPHMIYPVDVTDPYDTTKNKVVSDDIIYTLLRFTEDISAGGGSSITIESTGSVIVAEDVDAGEMGYDNGYYFYDFQHDLRTRYPVSEVYQRSNSAAIKPAEIEDLNWQTQRYYFSQALDVHIVVAGELFVPDPEIQLSTSSLSKTTIQGDTATSTFQLTNSSDGSLLDWTITTSDNWMSCNPDNGQTYYNEIEDITVTYDTSISAGVYNGQITVSDPDASNDPQTIDVTYNLATSSFETDFSEYPTGSGVPSGWTERWNTGANQPNIVTEVTNGPDTIYGGQTMEFRNGNNTEYLLSLDVVDDSDKIEILTLMSTHNDGNNTNRVYFRASGATNSENFYYFQPQPLSNNAIITSYVNGSFNGSVGFISKTIDIDTWYWARIQANGTTINAKIWEYGTSEPGSWELSGTNSDHASGWAGLGPFSHTTYNHFDYFATERSISKWPIPVPEAVPVIELSTSSITASANTGNDATSDSFTVSTKIDGTTLNWSASDDVGWLSLAPETGSVSYGSSDTVNVNYSTSALASGSYSATITVSDPSASNTPQTIDVDLEMIEVPPEPEPDVGWVDRTSNEYWDTWTTSNGTYVASGGYWESGSSLNKRINPEVAEGSNTTWVNNFIPGAVRVVFDTYDEVGLDITTQTLGRVFNVTASAGVIYEYDNFPYGDTIRDIDLYRFDDFVFRATSIELWKGVTPDDDFTGDDNDLPNSDRWNTIGSSGGTIQSNELSQYTSPTHTLESVFTLGDDFDIQVDYSTAGVNSEGWAGILAVIVDADNQAEVDIEWRLASPYYQWASHIEVGGTTSHVQSFVLDTLTSKLRITRVSSTLTTYGWNGTSWQSIDSESSFSTGDVTIRLQSKSWTNNPNIEITFDNFTVNSADIIKTYPG